MANLEKERMKINTKYKTAEGEEKAKLFQQLKNKTDEIKKLDKIIRDMEGDEDEY